MKYFFIIVLSSMLFSCYQVERNCTNFKTGTFESSIVIDNIDYTSTFTRTNDLQIETFENKTDSATVRWINDCEVIFKTINPKSMAERKDIHLKILSTTDSSYTFEYSYVGEVIKQKGIAKKLK
ncbi:DNA topoisomerase IV [Flavobacteriaceae bacterium S0825]|uniref:DNA topoisomerase IV n=1 Tax=Gaetbulibacter sp. S0825 TaxID=2720084 RepID=UPI001431954C|nr:DNA topoisomerase IV [Gaetbulibacter sp. S0825]MCK0109688.1 DNA topoisomerase IV [Flavobacteriaceae bacterium S0825]NIX65320.1 DNA topoisomerase IV [Gaetbulibacter sp. S0825]